MKLICQVQFATHVFGLFFICLLRWYTMWSSWLAHFTFATEMLVLFSFVRRCNWVQRNATTVDCNDTPLSFSIIFFHSSGSFVFAISNFLATQFSNCLFLFRFSFPSLFWFAFHFISICTKTYRLADTCIAWIWYSCKTITLPFAIAETCAESVRMGKYLYLNLQAHNSKNKNHLQWPNRRTHICVQCRYCYTMCFVVWKGINKTKDDTFDTRQTTKTNEIRNFLSLIRFRLHTTQQRL